MDKKKVFRLAVALLGDFGIYGKNCMACLAMEIELKKTRLINSNWQKVLDFSAFPVIRTFGWHAFFPVSSLSARNSWELTKVSKYKQCEQLISK